MKTRIFLISLLAINLIVFGFLIQKRNNKSKNKLEKENIKFVDKYNKQFQDKIQIVSGERSIYINTISNNLLEENVDLEYDQWIKVLDNYNKEINVLKKEEETLKKYCVDFSYKDSKTNSMCQSMVFNYETAINYYVKDVESFNSFLDTFNAKEENVKKEMFFNEYQYIDINNDGKYIGK